MVSAEIKVTMVGKTPAFVTTNTNPQLLKIFGSTTLPNDPLVYYPAYYPLHKLVLSDFRALKVDTQFSPKAQEVIAALNAIESKVAQRELPELAFKTTPYEHQLLGLVHLFYYYRAALFYSCGLGKSKIIIDWQRLTKCWPLIVCPRVVLRVWMRELRVHGIEQEFALVDATSKTGKLRQLQDARNYQGVVMTYDTARLYYEEIAQAIPYDAIVCDESHYIKGTFSGRTKTLLQLCKKAGRRVIMSGTPSLGDPRDLYPQYKLLAPYLVPWTYNQFVQHFCIISPMNKHIIKGYRNLDQLHTRVDLVALRKTKEECLDLPSRVIIDMPVSLKGEQLGTYNSMLLQTEFQELRERLEAAFQGGGTLSIPNAAILVNKLLQVSSGFLMMKPPEICDGCGYLPGCVKESIKPYTGKCQKATKIDKPPVLRFEENAKLTTLLELLEEILVEPKNKCIVWGQFIEELDILEEAISARWGCVRVDGSTSQHVEKLAEEFNTDSKCRVYLGQVATGVGITLNSATYSIYYSLPWKLGDYLQSIDRNYRIGQTGTVTIYRLIASGTVDTFVAQALTRKNNVSSTLIESLNCVMCPNADFCGKHDISLYDEQCKYPRRVLKPSTKVSEIS